VASSKIYANEECHAAKVGTKLQLFGGTAEICQLFFYLAAKNVTTLSIKYGF